jgi:aspartate racemase
MSTTIIGILGGMGPRATVEFEQRLLAQFQATDQDLPTIITINDGSIPDRSLFLLGLGPSPALQLATNAKKLVNLGASIMCMPCNTAHASSILDNLNAPIIDMPQASLEIAQMQHAQNVLILGTIGTKQSGVFDNRADSITCHYPKASGQRFVDRLIADVKLGKPITNARIGRLKLLIQASDCDVAILACTELSLLKDFLQDTPIIDSLDALAQTTKNHIALLEPVV